MLEEKLARNNELLEQLNNNFARFFQLQESAAPEGASLSLTEGTAATNAPLLEDLSIAEISALAVLYPQLEPKEGHIPVDCFDDVKILVKSKDETPDSLKSDQLYAALSGVTPATVAHRHIQLELCRAVVKHWDKLEGIDGRRDFINLWLETPQAKRDKLKPKAKKAEAKVEAKTDTQKTDAVTATTTTAANDGAEVTAEQIAAAKSLFIKAAAKDKSEAVRIMKLYGADKFSEVPVGRYGDFIDALEIMIGDE